MKGKKEHTILLVEDNDGLRLTLREYLEDAGYRVLLAADGVSAIKHILDADVDLIISDYRMDVLGGDYWLKFLQRFCGDIHIIIISGYLKQGIVLPFEFLAKPFEYSVLAGIVKRLLSETDTSRGE